MSTSKSEFGWCRLILYIISAIVAYLLVNRFAPIEAGMRDLIIAVLAFLAALFLLMWLSRFICGMLGGSGKTAQSRTSASTTTAAAATTAGAAAAATASAAKSTAGAAKSGTKATADTVKSSADKTATQASKAAKATNASKSDGDKAKSSKAKSKGDKSSASSTGAKASSTSQAASNADEGKRPSNMMTAARSGGADNLKEIKGIGPKLEKLCHSLGVYHFDQIADWKSDEIAWMDSNLEGFRGRVSRDNWVGQAKILASGGTTEFSEREAKKS